MEINAIDLFCGIGGLTNGLSQAGINVLAGVDLDDTCQYAYQENNDAAFINKSVNEVNGGDLKDLFSEKEGYTVIVGCAPCQPFSSYQKKKNHKDWGLLYEFLRIVKETSPDIVSMENVPNLKSKKVFMDFVTGLKDLGYFIAFNTFDAAKYGVPQRRQRLLLLASKLGEIDFTKRIYEIKTVQDSIGNLQTIEAGCLINLNDRIHVASNLSETNFSRIRQSVQGGTWEDWDKELLPDCYKKESGQSFKSVYGRMSWNDVAPTLTTQFNRYGTGRFGHPEQDRAISIREGALLQSFPPDYKFLDASKKINLNQLARHIGNAVPPLLAKFIGDSIVEHLERYEADE